MMNVATKHEDKMDWITRLKLCFSVLFRGLKPDPEDYLTRKEGAIKKRMDQMRKDLESTIRPRTESRMKSDSDFWDQ